MSCKASVICGEKLTTVMERNEPIKAIIKPATRVTILVFIAKKKHHLFFTTVYKYIYIFKYIIYIFIYLFIIEKTSYTPTLRVNNYNTFFSSEALPSINIAYSPSYRP